MSGVANWIRDEEEWYWSWDGDEGAECGGG
jgi:hypothetical protein